MTAAALGWLGVACLLLPLAALCVVLAVALNPAMAAIVGGPVLFAAGRRAVRGRRA